MTARVDRAFVAEVRTALAERLRSIADEATTDGWVHLEHRQLADRIKAIVAGWRWPAGPADVDLRTNGADLLGHAVRLATQLRNLQGASGLFTGGDNVDSPPDSAFSVNDLADALLMLRRANEIGHESRDETPEGQDHAAAERLADLLESLLAAATPALTDGGVHTPNHRWEISAALARLHRLTSQPALAERVDQWLAEGIDIDDDGLYSERSANYAAYVSNPSLLTIAEIFGRSDLLDAVERNLDATLDLLLPDGSVETVLSRRQDQRFAVPLAGYLLPLRRLALLRGRGDLAWAAGLALAQGVLLPAEAATHMVLHPDIALALPEPVVSARPRRRVFTAAGLLMDHRPAGTTVLFGGSDYPRHRRIRSGLANSPTFLRLFAGAAVLESARLSRTFFGLGPFRGDGLTVAGTAADETTVTLTETVSAAYYQPMTPADRDPRGHYALVDDGRFSAEMDFGRRARDEVTLTTTVQARLTTTGVELTIDVTGAVVDWALELAFRPGGIMTGARAIGDHAWQLDTLPPNGVDQRDGGPVGGAAGRTAGYGEAGYRVDGDAIRVALVEVSDGRGGPLPASHSAPTYEPGEEYGFLGGTDAATGEKLYVAGRVPARVRLRIDGNPSGHVND